MEDSYEERILSQWFIHSLLAEYWLHEILLHVLEYLGIISVMFFHSHCEPMFVISYNFQKYPARNTKKPSGKTCFLILSINY